MEERLDTPWITIGEFFMIPPLKLVTYSSSPAVGELLQRLDGQDATEVNCGLGGDSQVLLPLDMFWEGFGILSSFNLVKTTHRKTE